MSVLTALARAHAVAAGQAQPIATVRHVHVAKRPFVFIPLALAGEPNAPLAAMIGDDPAAPRFLFVSQPYDRRQRFEFTAALGMALNTYIGGFSSVTTPGRQVPGGDGPQLWVPSTAGLNFLRLFGRSLRFQSTEGPYAVPLTVPRLGMWLTFLAEQAERPGSSTLVAATDVLARHWATGQSALEDAHLAALLAWIEPPDGMTGAEAARAAENPVDHPPAGPATDPVFDRVELAPAIDACRTAGPHTMRQTRAKLEKLLRDQVTPTWDLMWRSIDRMRMLPPGASVASRWQRDLARCAQYCADLAADSRFPQAKRDGAVRAAKRLDELERLQDAFDADRALDDPLVMAEHRLEGEAFEGTVVRSEPHRRTGQAKRPLITVSTTDRIRFSLGEATLSCQRFPKQEAQIVSITDSAGGREVVLELAGGMGQKTLPAEGSLPAVGEHVCYSKLRQKFRPRGDFPDKTQTPWTHGGPPPDPTKPVSQDTPEEEQS